MAQSLMPIWAPENLKLVNLFMNNHEMCECYEKWTIGLHRYDIKSLKYFKSCKLDFELMKMKKITSCDSQRPSFGEILLQIIDVE